MHACSVNVRIQRTARLAQLDGMKWKVVRLELASSWQFPRGSAGRSYLIRLPLADDGTIDRAALESYPSRATVRRHWPNQADMIGYVERTPTGYAIRYDILDESAPYRTRDTNGGSTDRLFALNAESITVGEEILLTEPDGRRLSFRVADLH